jgi:hypothetical protein
MSLNITNRYSATTIHFSISLFIFSIFLFVLLYYWYPAPHFSAAGGWQGVKIVAAVDLILGPLLTLIIFNINKSRKELTLDFLLIAMIQLGALSWGISTVYSQRPLALTFWEDKFYSVSAEHFPAYGIELDTLKQFGESYPVFIYVQEPTTDEHRQLFLNKTIGESIPPNLIPELYEPISTHFSDISKHSIDMSEIMIINSTLNDEISALLKKTNTKLEDNYYIPLKSSFSEIVIVFDKDSNYIGYASTPYI